MRCFSRISLWVMPWLGKTIWNGPNAGINQPWNWNLTLSPLSNVYVLFSADSVSTLTLCVLLFLIRPRSSLSFLFVLFVSVEQSLLSWCAQWFSFLCESQLSNERMMQKSFFVFVVLLSSHFSDHHASLASLWSEAIALLLRHFGVGHRSVSSTRNFLLLAICATLGRFRIRAWNHRCNPIQRSSEGGLQPTSVQLLDSSLSLCGPARFRWIAIHDQSETVRGLVNAGLDRFAFRWCHHGREWSTSTIWNAIEWWIKWFTSVTREIWYLQSLILFFDVVTWKKSNLFWCCLYQFTLGIEIYRYIYLSEMSTILIYVNQLMLMRREKS